MRMHMLLIAVLALVAAGSASAGANGKPKLVRIVKDHGAFTATLTFRGRGITHGITKPTVAVWKHGHLVLRHRFCPLDWSRNSACMFPSFAYARRSGTLRPAFRDVAPPGTPAFEVDLYSGGAHCCEQSFIALGGSHPSWIAHDWKNPGFLGRRIDGRYYFVSGDDRFAYAFTSYAGSWFPSQIWTIRRGRLVDVTRSEPKLVRINARQAWHWYLRGRRDHTERGRGILAGWCADQYLLGRGPRCQQTLATALRRGWLDSDVGAPGRAFIRDLNKDLRRWGYEQRSGV